MSMEIVWSDVALISLSDTLKYTHEEFGDIQVRKLIERIRKTTERLAIFPFSAAIIPESIKNGKQYRSVTIDHTLRLIYKIELSTITILFVGNTYMDLKHIIEKVNKV